MRTGIRAAIRPLLPLLAALFAAPAALGDWVVNTASDTVNPTCGTIGGTCSLRDAITLSQGAGGAIHFAIGTGHQTINLMSNLPDLIQPTVIDGRTQPGYAGVPLIEIHRADAGTAWRGFHLGQPPAVTSGLITIKALVINHFSGVCGDCGGIVMENVGDSAIQGCYIGTDATGTVADGNSTGILDNSYGGNIIGGGPVADRNVISGNANGIIIGGTYTKKNLIQGNYFGLNALGSGEIHNAGASIFVTGPPAPGFSPGIMIGGPVGSGLGNVFGGIGGSGSAIDIRGSGDINATNNVIQGNLIGLDPTGLISLPLEHGVVLEGNISDKILDNVISVTGNAIEFLVDVTTTTGVTVQGNFLGTDVTGNRVPVAGGYGINFSGGQSNTIGGTAAGQGNVIGGFLNGIYVGPMSDGNVILGNRIGIGVNGSAIPNVQAGIVVLSSGATTIGGVNPGEGNIIALNGIRPPTGPFFPIVPAVAIENTVGNVIRGNSIYGNLGKGIDLTSPFISTPTPNTPGSPHGGPNRLQSFPLINSVTFPDASHVRIQGTLNSKAASIFTLDFYANSPPVHPGDYLQGQTWIGFDGKSTDNSGNVAFDITFPVSGAPNVWISATATDAGNNTSEFSQRSLFSVTPRHGPASGGTATVLKGQLFQAGAAVHFGGTTATGVGFIDASTLNAPSPPLPAGLLLDVTVTNPDTSQAVMQNAWVSDFLDVPSGSGLYPWVTSLAGEGVTAGCGGGNYCPNSIVTRAQMAVFLLRGKYGPWWIPPAPTGTVFTDVPAGSFAAAWIEELNRESIAGGCGGGNYCPSNAVTRAQMAVFLLRTKNGPTYNPPPCTGIFGDVSCTPTPAFAVNWIEQLYVQGISGGCSSSPLLFCPNNGVTRGQMAVFLVTTFRIP